MTQNQAAIAYADALNSFKGISAKVWVGGKVVRVYVRARGRDMGYLELYVNGAVRKNTLQYTCLNLAVVGMSPLDTAISAAVTSVHGRAISDR